jgi:tRNA(fMet)-specific endonuclease VapC
MKYLLDADVCTALINGTSAKARCCYSDALRKGEGLAVSSVVVHQLWHRASKVGQNTRYARTLSAFFSQEITVLDYTESDAKAAGEIRADLERRGERIGEYDTLIAGQAFCRNLTLVTANTREFARVKGLVVEDWTV